MDRTLTLVIYMAVLTWLSVMVAALLRVKGWTPDGLKLAAGNRESLPAPSPLAGRADRAARNTIDNFVLFAAIALVAHVSGIQNPRIALGAEVFFVARILYLPTYYAGIAYLRTVVWTVGIVGLVMMISALV